LIDLTSTAETLETEAVTMDTCHQMLKRRRRRALWRDDDGKRT